MPSHRFARTHRPFQRYGHAARLLLAGLAVVLTACGGAAAAPEAPLPEAPADTADEQSQPPTSASQEQIPLQPDPPTSAPTDAPDLGTVQVARVASYLDVHATPGDVEPMRTLPPTTDFGSATVVLVQQVGEGELAGWLHVLLPGRPNGETGWIRAVDVELQDVEVTVHVDLAQRELTVYADADADADAEPLLTTPVAIGDPDHPTPVGRFFVTDKVRAPDPDGAYGPYALGLSGRSEVLTEFAGGDGQIGIHGTNDPSSIGEAASHGCVRVPNAVVRELVTLLPLGTPVVIS